MAGVLGICESGGESVPRRIAEDLDRQAARQEVPQAHRPQAGLLFHSQELPPREDGTRRCFSRAGYDSLKAAQTDLDHVRALLGLADTDDAEGLTQIADMLEKVADEKAPLPDIEATRRRLSHGLDLTNRLTVGEWLDMWLAGKKGRQSAISRDESNIRVHLKPKIGHLRLDRLRVTHLSQMFEAIAEDNVEIAEGNAARRKAFEDLAQIPGRGATPAPGARR